MKSLLNIIKDKIFIVCLIYSLTFFILGFFSPESTHKTMLAFVKSYISQVKFDVLNIFFNNITIAFIIILGSIIVIPSFALIGLNFFLLGLMVKYFMLQEKLKIFIISLLPHSIIEIPAIFLAFFYGIKIFNIFYLEKHRFDKVFFENLKKYFINIVILFFIASIIEVYVTPFILSFFLKDNFIF